MRVYLSPYDGIIKSAHTLKPVRVKFADGEDLLLCPALAVMVLKLLEDMGEDSMNATIESMSGSEKGYIAVQNRAFMKYKDE